MTEKQILIKLYQRLDGELSDSELEAINRHLDENPRWAATFQDIQKMEYRFKNEKNSLKPTGAGLKENILNQIDMEKYETPRNEPVVRLKPGFWTQPVVRFAYAYALGILTGLVIYLVYQGEVTTTDTPTSGMAGTIYDSRSFENMKSAGIMQFESPEVSTLCHVKYSTKLVEIRLELSSEDAVSARIEFDPRSVGILNVLNVNVSEQTSVFSASSYVRIDNVGNNSFIIQLANKTSLQNEIDFRIFQNEFPVYHNAVQINQ